jgi:hypothetical protein
VKESEHNEGRAAANIEALPALFRDALRETLLEGEQVEQVLFIASERVLGTRLPAVALVAADTCLIFVTESEETVADVRWGVRTLVVPYRSIAAVELGHVFLRGQLRLRLFGTRSALTSRALIIYEPHSGELRIPYSTLDRQVVREFFQHLRTRLRQSN